jgi:hypothetical protein
MRHERDEIGDAAAAALIELGLDADTVLALDTHADPRLNALLDQTRAMPKWLDHELLRRGQTVFLRYAASANLALLYYSLLGGFSAPKIVRVLDATGYLTKASADATWRRLVRNVQFCTIIMPMS